MPERKIIGMGAEKSVFKDTTNNSDAFQRKRGKRVIAEIRDEDETSDTVKARYYLAKVTHLLFPEYVPDVDRAGSKYDDKTGYFIRAEEMHRDIVHRLINYKDTRLEQDKSVPKLAYRLVDKLVKQRKRDPKIYEFMKKFESAGLPFDAYVGNFSYDREGKLKNLDVVNPWNVYTDHLGKKKLEWEFEEEKVLAAIEQLPEEKKLQALKYWKRFQALFEKAKKEIEGN